MGSGKRTARRGAPAPAPAASACQYRPHEHRAHTGSGYAYGYIRPGPHHSLGSSETSRVQFHALHTTHNHNPHPASCTPLYPFRRSSTRVPTPQPQPLTSLWLQPPIGFSSQLECQHHRASQTKQSKCAQTSRHSAFKDLLRDSGWIELLQLGQ